MNPATRIILFSVFALATCASAIADPSMRSISSSKQFVVYSADPNLRSQLAIKAEDFKKEVLSQLKLQDDWKMTIILNADAAPPESRRAPKFQVGVYEADATTLKIQIDIFDRSFLKEPEFETQLMNAIVLEIMLRGARVRAGRNIDPAPAWFVEGLLERMRTRDGGVRAGLYAGLLAASEPPRIEDFFRTRPENLDPTSRSIYRVQAAALLDALMGQPDGLDGLRTYLSSPRRHPASINEVVESFPSLENDRDNLGRRWILSMARSSATNRIEPLSARKTGEELATILDIQALPDPRNPSVASASGPFALETIARSQNGKFIITQKSEELLRLSTRAHPVYRSLVDEYYRIVSELSAKPKARVEKRIAAAEEARAALRGRVAELQSHMDWVEVNQIQSENQELVVALEDIEEMESPPPRADRISRHLDALAERGW